MIKANFKISKTNEYKNNYENIEENEKRDLTKSEFEDFIIKCGAAGSFMVFRSDKKDEELGMDQLW